MPATEWETSGESLPVRKHMHHDTPDWVRDDAVFFLTVCAEPRGMNSLATPSIAEAIREATRHRRELGNWWPHLLVIMPDHLHLLVTFPPEVSMRQVVKDWKRWLATEHRVDWQDGFFDHRLRNDESFDEKAHYLRMNPVRAGLVERWQDWPYLWDAARL